MKQWTVFFCVLMGVKILFAQDSLPPNLKKNINSGWFLSLQERNDLPLPIAGLLSYLITPKGVDYGESNHFDLGDTHDFKMALSKVTAKGVRYQLAVRTALYTKPETLFDESMEEMTGQVIPVFWTEKNTYSFQIDNREGVKPFAYSVKFALSHLSSDKPSKLGASAHQLTYHENVLPHKQPQYEYLDNEKADRFSLSLTPVFIVRKDIIENDPQLLELFTELEYSLHTIWGYSYLALKIGGSSKIDLSFFNKKKSQHKDLGDLHLALSVKGIAHRDGLHIKPQLDIGWEKGAVGINSFMEYNLGSLYNDVDYNFRNHKSITRGFVSGLKLIFRLHKN